MTVAFVLHAAAAFERNVDEGFAARRLADDELKWGLTGSYPLGSVVERAGSLPSVGPTIAEPIRLKDWLKADLKGAILGFLGSGTGVGALIGGVAASAIEAIDSI